MVRKVRDACLDEVLEGEIVLLRWVERRADCDYVRHELRAVLGDAVDGETAPISARRVRVPDVLESRGYVRTSRVHQG